MAYELYCKNCEKKLLKFEKYEKKYKSPIAYCKHCGSEYIDPRCHELAVEGIPGAEFKVTRDIVLFVIGGLITWRGYYMMGMISLGTPAEMQKVLPAVILLLGIAIIIGAIVDTFRILSGSKKRKYESLLEESKERMKNEQYVQKLKDLGYLKQ